MLKKSFLNKIKEQLLTQKKEILEQIKQEQEIDVEGDEIDNIQGNLLIEMNNHLSTRASSKLKRIEEAILRIENKTYGFCLDCDEEIAEKRLLFNPHFQICISCAEDREIEEKQRKRL
jgi:DnaK suppressor protein